MKPRGAGQAAAAACALAASLALFWPGTALFDSVEQYRQAVSGVVTDWHPPVMARLWGALAQVWPGTGPMLVLQLGLYWLGLGQLAAALARRGRQAAGWAVLVVGIAPVLSCWMGAILKDAQLLGALTAATGIAAWHPLSEQQRPRWATAAILVLLLYATLVRANAVFATAPLALALLGWFGLPKLRWRAAASIGLIVGVLVLSPLANRRLFGAEREGPENSLLLYDIAGTSIRAGTDSAGVSAAKWRALAAAGCYSPLEWDAFSEPGPCTIGAGLAAQPETPPLYGIWRQTIARHPVAYAAHRLAHFNLTMRFLAGPDEPRAVAPVDSEPNRLGLGANPSAAQRAWQDVGLLWAATPLAWPILWLALAAVGLWASLSAPQTPERRLAQALLLSAVCGGLSYALVSVAPDLRYHLWTILASGLGLVLLAWTGGIARRHLAVAGAVAGAVIVAGTAARLLLPAFTIS
jgi:hypothetical protein